jgi:small subunit ribosomal protein S6
MMIGYEILLMLDPELPDDRQEEIVTRVREGIEGSGGNWGAHDVWGRRKLAYEIDHKAEGVYHLLTFDAEPEALAEVSRVLKITDGVMRHLAVKRTAATGPAQPLETSVEHRQDSEEQATPVG